MVYVPIAPPPGVASNGARYSKRGRWVDCDKIRFVEDAPRVIGGWEQRTTTGGDPLASVVASPETEAPRGIFALRDNLGGRYVFIGTTQRLFSMDSDGDLVDITPTGFVAGTRDSSIADGYGTGSYGRQAYGTRRTGSGLMTNPVGMWRFDAWGQDLLAAGPLRQNTTLYAYTPGSPGDAAAVTNAPTDFNDFLVTDQRIVMVIGSGPNHRQVKWSASENRTLWAPAVTNQAGDITLTGAGELRAGVRVGSDILIIGEQDAHVARYLGPPYVYGFNRIGENCGCVSANAVVVAGSFAMWFTGREFYRFDGSLTPIPCAVSDWLADTLVTSEVSKTFGYHNSDHNEVVWLFQAVDAPGEAPDCSRYITYNYALNAWSYGTLDRSVGLPRGVTSTVVMVDPDGVIYNHELESVDVDGAYIRTGPIEIADGNNVAYIDQVIAATTGGLDGVSVYLHCRDHPNGATRTTGPFSFAYNPAAVRAYGREVELEIRPGDRATQALGAFRLNIKAGGRK